MSPLVTDSNPLVGSFEPVSAEPSLGLRTSINPPRFLQIPPGAVISVIMDPRNPDSMVRWRLVRVRENGRYWDLECACTVPGCNRTSEVKMTYKGVHPQRQR
jgi:hypothetical protein